MYVLTGLPPVSDIRPTVCPAPMAHTATKSFMSPPRQSFRPPARVYADDRRFLFFA
jgi:hypothetical protein